jgi:hypothetical protein
VKFDKVGAQGLSCSCLRPRLHIWELGDWYGCVAMYDRLILEAFVWKIRLLVLFRYFRDGLAATHEVAGNYQNDQVVSYRLVPHHAYESLQLIKTDEVLDYMRHYTCWMSSNVCKHVFTQYTGAQEHRFLETVSIKEL